MEQTKQCTRCKNWKPITEFHRAKRKPDGHVSWCKQCTSEYQKEYNRHNSQKRREYRERPDVKQRRREYRRQPQRRQYDIEYLRAWKKRNPEYAAEYAKKNRERLRKYQRSRRAQNTAWRRRWYRTEKGRECLLVNSHRYRARMAGAPGNHTADEVRELKRLSNYTCMASGERDRLETDHIIPLTRGGCNCIHNLQVLCRSCNAAKGNRNRQDYRPPQILDWLASLPTEPYRCEIHS